MTDPLADGRPRCWWSSAGSERPDPLMVAYHDDEWGTPCNDDVELFERLALESFQAGLSWSTILRKIDTYRAAFANFDVEAVAAFDDSDVERCMADPGIVRNRGKVTSAIGNARAWLELDDPVGFIWSFTDGVPVQNQWTNLSGVPAETDASRAMSKELKRRGFRFVGPTICYAFMQATGMVNDHLVDCFRYDECRALA
jgi:DNA-3-methyladenine glycosylase I